MREDLIKEKLEGTAQEEKTQEEKTQEERTQEDCAKEEKAARRRHIFQIVIRELNPLAIIKNMRILITIFLCVINFFVWVLGSFAISIYSDDYYQSMNQKEILNSLKTELGVREFPDDFKLIKSTSDMTFFDDDDEIDICIYSNYSEEDWRKVIPENYGISDDCYQRRKYEIKRVNGLLNLGAKYKLVITSQACATSIDDVIYRTGEAYESNAPVKILGLTILLIFISFLPLYPYEKIVDHFRYRKDEMSL